MSKNKPEIIIFKNRPELIKILKELFPELLKHSDLKFKTYRNSSYDCHYDILCNPKYSILDLPIKSEQGLKDKLNKECVLTNIWGEWYVELKEFATPSYGKGFIGYYLED